MTQTKFGEQACQKFRAKLDSYIDNELLAETNLEMIEHFSRCTSCTQEAQDRRSVRRRLRSAVRETPVPAGLEERVRDRLRERKQPLLRKPYLMAIAAALALCVGIFRLRDPGAGLLRIAFDDHVHCAVMHHPVPDSPQEANQLPEQLRGLTGLVQERIQPGFDLILAHECEDQGRNFVHFTFRGGQHLLSLVITRRADGESLGHGIRQASRDHLQLAALETAKFFVYTVSDLSERGNKDILGQISPTVQEFLTQLQG